MFTLCIVVRVYLAVLEIVSGIRVNHHDIHSDDVSNFNTSNDVTDTHAYYLQVTY